MDKYHQQASDSPGDVAGEPELQAELRLIAQLYATQPMPHPTPAATRQLLSRLLIEETITTIHSRYQSPKSMISVLRMARWHLRLLGPWFWITSVLLLLLGFFLAPALQQNGANVLIILLPLSAILSITYALRVLKSGARGVEASCPTNIVEVLTGLALAIVCFDGLLGLIATIGMALVRWAPFAPLLAAWLGPLLLLVGISFPIALRWGTTPAIIVGGGPWLLLVSIAMLFPDLALGQFLWSGQTGSSQMVHFLTAGLGMLILLLLFLRGSVWQRLLVQL